MRIVTAAEMKQIEKKADESGLSYRQMMENAGAAAATTILSRMGGQAGRFVIFTGKGNNGGDGFVVARLLHQAGRQVECVLVDGTPATGDARYNFELACRLGIPMHPWEDGAHGQEQAGCIVDAVYGTGFHGALRQRAREAAQAVNRAGETGKTVVALDIPSGVNADTGECDPDAVRAVLTIAFDSLKPAHVTQPGRDCCGEVACADIGIPESCHRLG